MSLLSRYLIQTNRLSMARDKCQRMNYHVLQPACHANIIHNINNNNNKNNNRNNIYNKSLLKELRRNDISIMSKRFESSSTGFSFVNTAFLADMWQSISNSTPVAYMQNGLVEIHDASGLPWWASIVLSTFLFRTAITLPLTIYQNKITARLENLGIEMKSVAEELKKEAAVAKQKFNWTKEHTFAVFQRSLKRQWNERVVRDNCHPAKTFIVLWGQIPLWICQSVALRNLVHMLPNPNTLEAKIIFTQMTLGGFLWIPNLTEVDSSYILPIALGLTNLAIIEIQSAVRRSPSSKFQNVATNIFRGLSLAMIPVAASVPSALCVYWVTSSLYGLSQNLFLLSPKIRRLVRIPKTPTELQTPYEHLSHQFQNRLGIIHKSNK